MKLLFFTPHVAILQHTLPEAYIGRALSKLGYSISYLTCGKAQNYCAAMAASGLSPIHSLKDSKRICSRCKIGSSVISAVYGFPFDTLSNHISQNDYETIETIASEACNAKSLDTVYLNVNVGRIALYELTLAHKKVSTNLTDLQWLDYQIYLVNSLRTLLAFSRYIKKSKPELILTFSPQYSNINSCMQYAIQQGIRVLFMESGTNLSNRLGTVRVWDWHVHKLVNPALVYWDSSSCNQVTASSASKVTSHFKQLLFGHHFAVFSAAHDGGKNIRELWNIDASKKILLMTLSSYDEAYAAYLIDGFSYKKVFSDIFITQSEWIQATINWVAARPDLFLVIRVHPRDFPNKRENVRSEQSIPLQKLLKNTPRNVYVNWPSENISLYDILEHADVLLTGWSITAIEALILGIPVVTYDSNLPSYPNDIHYTGRSEGEYYSNIIAALKNGWSENNIINGFRWLAFNFDTCVITISKKFGEFELSRGTIIQRIWRRFKNKIPALAYFIELLKWKDAEMEIKTLSCMLRNNFDALPPARKFLEKKQKIRDDRLIIYVELRKIYNLLYGKDIASKSESGLSFRIRSFLTSRGLM